jgi:hypothetical protein
MMPNTGLAATNASQAYSHGRTRAVRLYVGGLARSAAEEGSKGLVTKFVCRKRDKHTK